MTVEVIESTTGEVPVFGFGTSKKQVTIQPKTLVVKVRDDVMPKVSSAVQEAVERSAPARAEAKARTSAAWQALRGDYMVAQPPKKRGKASGLVVGVIGTVAAVGAATWAAARQLRTPEWVSQGDEPTDSMSSTTRPADQPASATRMSARSKPKPASDDAAGASPDEVLADMAESSRDGLRNR